MSSAKISDIKKDKETVLVTGAAGFVGFHLCRRFFAEGWNVIGWDTDRVNYPTTTIRKERLEILLKEAPSNFIYKDVNIENMEEVEAAWEPLIGKICHLAARAGVRESLTNPSPYIYTNVVGHFNLMEMARQHRVQHFLYASSSSVYGSDSQVPFQEKEACNSPLSLYAATKKADELMTYSYSHLFRLPATGLRFFTVYGPWGRPDMAVYDFTRRIYQGMPLPVFNHGINRRAYTYIDDVIEGIVAAIESPPSEERVPHRVFNIGTREMVTTERMIGLLEGLCGRKANCEMMEAFSCDMLDTAADLTLLENQTHYAPKIPIEVGLGKFVQWYREFHNVN